MRRLFFQHLVDSARKMYQTSALRGTRYGSTGVDYSRRSVSQQILVFAPIGLALRKQNEIGDKPTYFMSLWRFFFTTLKQVSFISNRLLRHNGVTCCFTFLLLGSRDLLMARRNPRAFCKHFIEALSLHERGITERKLGTRLHVLDAFCGTARAPED